VEHTDWEALDELLCRAVAERTGTVHAARTAAAGFQSQIAALLDTESGPVFVKGIRSDHPGAVRQHREAMINPVVLPVAPRLLWHAEVAGWDLLAFEALRDARHADYRPGSGDLPRVVEVMNRLGRIKCPDLPVKHAPQRWAAYLDDQAQAGLLDGDRLLHTDFNPLNILVTPARTWIIDWAWPTRGARFIDPACFAIRLITAGHTPAAAERWASRCEGWDTADPAAVDAFGVASARLFHEIAAEDPTPWKKELASAATAWHEHRAGTGNWVSASQ
jgi:RIO1 family